MMSLIIARPPSVRVRARQASSSVSLLAGARELRPSPAPQTVFWDSAGHWLGRSRSEGLYVWCRVRGLPEGRRGASPRFPGATDSRLVLPFRAPFSFLLPAEERPDLSPTPSKSLFLPKQMCSVLPSLPVPEPAGGPSCVLSVLGFRAEATGSTMPAAVSWQETRRLSHGTF